MTTKQQARELAKQLASMTDEQRQQLAEKMGTICTIEGRPLSLGNTLLLAMQADNVSVVGGFRQWRRAGRRVRKGEKALRIWVPVKKGNQEDNDEHINADEVHFFLGAVFDISQTEPIKEDN